MGYLLHFLPLLSLTAIEALALNLLVGRLDVLCMCQAAFVGFGAYTTAVLTTSAHWPVWLGIPAAVIGGALIGWCFGFLTATLNKERLVLATLAFQLLFTSAAVNWTDLTNGPEGIRGIPPLTILGPVLILALFASVLVLTYCLRLTLLGIIGDVLRESESFAAANGFDTRAVKSGYFALGAGTASLGGALFAHSATYIDPVSFSLNESVFLLSAVLIGGAGTPGGVLIGVFLVTVIPEALRFLGLQSAAAADIRQILYGIALLMVLVMRPQGVRQNA